MFKITILVNNKRETKMYDGAKTPAEILSEFGAGGMQFSLSSHPLDAAAMNTPIAALAANYGLGDTLFLAGVAKTQNA